MGTGPEFADIPWPALAFCLFHYSFFMTPSAHVLYPASLDTSLGGWDALPLAIAPLLPAPQLRCSIFKSIQKLSKTQQWQKVGHDWKQQQQNLSTNTKVY